MCVSGHLKLPVAVKLHRTRVFSSPWGNVGHQGLPVPLWETARSRRAALGPSGKAALSPGSLSRKNSCPSGLCHGPQAPLCGEPLFPQSVLRGFCPLSRHRASCPHRPSSPPWAVAVLAVALAVGVSSGSVPGGCCCPCLFLAELFVSSQILFSPSRWNSKRSLTLLGCVLKSWLCSGLPQ